MNLFAVMRAVVVVGAAGALFACGGDATTPTGDDGGYHASGDGGNGDDLRGGDDAQTGDDDAAAAADAALTSGDAAPGTDAGDAGDAGAHDGGACPPDDPIVGDVTATTGVGFYVTNTASTTRYVVIGGANCDVFTIDGSHLSLPFSCGCECTAPRQPVTYATLAPGKSITIVWDGRHLVPYTTHIDCSVGGPASGRCVDVQQGGWRPVDAGQLTVHVGYTTSEPAGTFCGPSAPDTIQCTFMGGGGGQCGAGASGGPALQIASATFDLPATGSISVPVPIP